MAVFTKGLYNCACARTVCDWSCETYATMMSDLVPNTVVGYVPPLKKTNFDRLQVMSVDELEEWYWWMHKEMMRYTDSRVFLHDWLRQEASET